MIKYGIMLRDGYGVKIDERESVKYFKRAADKGDAQGMAEYALTFVLNNWIECNKSEIVEYCKTAVEMGNTDELRVYGLIFHIGFGVQKKNIRSSPLL